MDHLHLVSEQIEREALVSLHACCPSDTKQALGLELVEVADGIAACSTKDPSILLNRTLGLGMTSPVTDQAVRQVHITYEKRSIDSYFLHVYQESLSASAQTELRKFV
ncbi:MAG: hypothetical protein KDC35_16745 [Acidobacteria bacterium]|nr:hypothetical protein [Acidobacteriota bacterium]